MRDEATVFASTCHNIYGVQSLTFRLGVIDEYFFIEQCSV